GYPVVFAVFALRNTSRETFRMEVREVVSSYRESLRCLETDRETLMRKAHERYPLLNYNDIDSYYRLLKFVFTPELKKGLQFYFNEAAQLGLMAEVPEIHFTVL
ncbi:MAG TPA: hypothetical protein PK200_07760, partial [Spirochaetota bacterium]|nr:hypothetical protein [Spirochaetota bacterium]